VNRTPGGGGGRLENTDETGNAAELLVGATTTGTAGDGATSGQASVPMQSPVLRKGRGNKLMATEYNETDRTAVDAARSYENSRAALPIAGVGLIGPMLGFCSGRHARDIARSGRPTTSGYMVAMALTLGCTTLLFLHHACAAPGASPFCVFWKREPKMLPIMALGWSHRDRGVDGADLPWANEAERNAKRVFPHKALYLNPLWFTIRQIVYFASGSGQRLSCESPPQAGCFP
jgi:hypothetical protein